MFTNPHNQNLLNDVMRVLNGETTEQPIRPIPTWLSEAAVEAVKSLNEAYNSGEVMTLEIQRDILRKHLSEAVSNCNCEVSKDTPIQFEEAIAEAKRAGNRPMTGVPAGASKEDHEKARKANPFKVGLSKGVPAGAGAKKEEFEDVNEANQRLRKPKPHEEVYYKWFDGVEVSIMDMSKITKEIQAALDRKADLDKVMPELVKKYGKNSPTKKEEFEEDELDEAHQSGSFAAFVKTKGDSTFTSTNALRFRTEAEAKQYGENLRNRWLAVTEIKVMPSTDKPNYEMVNNVVKPIKESSHNSEEFEEMVMESDPTELELREFLTQLTSEEVTILRNIINETR